MLTAAWNNKLITNIMSRAWETDHHRNEYFFLPFFTRINWTLLPVINLIVVSFQETPIVHSSRTFHSLNSMLELGSETALQKKKTIACVVKELSYNLKSLNDALSLQIQRGLNPERNLSELAFKCRDTPLICLRLLYDLLIPLNNTHGSLFILSTLLTQQPSATSAIVFGSYQLCIAEDGETAWSIIQEGHQWNIACFLWVRGSDKRRHQWTSITLSCLKCYLSNQ